MKNHKSLAIVGLIVIVVIAGIVWNPWFSPCSGLSNAEIDSLNKPGVSVILRRGETVELLTPTERLTLVELLNRNTEDWNVTWHTAPSNSGTLDFEQNQKPILSLGFGNGFISKGWCQKSLNSFDQEELVAIIEHFLE